MSGVVVEEAPPGVEDCAPPPPPPPPPYAWLVCGIGFGRCVCGVVRAMRRLAYWDWEQRCNPDGEGRGEETGASGTVVGHEGGTRSECVPLFRSPVSCVCPSPCVA
jgi:hypothetical protein